MLQMLVLFGVQEAQAQQMAPQAIVGVKPLEKLVNNIWFKVFSQLIALSPRMVMTAFLTYG